MTVVPAAVVGVAVDVGVAWGAIVAVAAGVGVGVGVAVTLAVVVGVGVTVAKVTTMVPVISVWSVQLYWNTPTSGKGRLHFTPGAMSPESQLPGDAILVDVWDLALLALTHSTVAPEGMGRLFGEKALSVMVMMNGPAAGDRACSCPGPASREAASARVRPAGHAFRRARLRLELQIRGAVRSPGGASSASTTLTPNAESLP